MINKVMIKCLTIMKVTTVWRTTELVEMVLMSTTSTLKMINFPAGIYMC